MRVLATIHMGPPSHNAGSELMIHTMLRWLAERGHDARALVGRGEDRTYQGVQYTSTEGMRGRDADRVRTDLHQWADVVATHLDHSRIAMRYAKRARKPLVHLVHNHLQLEANLVSSKNCDLAVFNSRWLAERVQWPHEQIIVRPPVWQDDYRTTPGDHVTLVNLTVTKGCEVFYELARRRREDRFLGVVGAYGHQIIRQIPNVEIGDHTGNMRDDVYARTRVLLMPSDYESWGRVAVEALASGIPVIAHPTEGLTESLGDAGIFCDRDDVDAWEAALKRLDDPDEYERVSKKCLARAEELDRLSNEDLDVWEKALLRLVGQ